MTIKLTEEQQSAIHTLKDFVKNGDTDTAILVGAAGVGKSSTIQYFIEHLPPRTRICMTSPTNKAVRVLKTMSLQKGLEVECVTIHSLLGLSMSVDANGKERLKPGGKSSLKDYDVVIIDECSMVNLELLGYIRKALKASPSTKIIFMGDINQLNPVDEKQSPVFAIKPQVRLTKVMRQRNENPILGLCTDIRKEIDNGTYNVPNIKSMTNDRGNIGIHVMSGESFYQWLPSAFNNAGFDKNPDSFRVLAWRNATVDYLNSHIQKIRYPDLTQPFAIGEGVVFSKPLHAISSNNNHSQDTPLREGWEKILCSTESEGIVKSIVEVEPFIFKPTKDQIKNNFDFRPFVIRRYALTVKLTHDQQDVNCTIAADKKEVKAMLSFIAANTRNQVVGMSWFLYYSLQKYFSEVRPQYALTIHKSQGSTYDNVFVHAGDILSNPNREEALRCLYVAVSRATTNLVISL